MKISKRVSSLWNFITHKIRSQRLESQNIPSTLTESKDIIHRRSAWSKFDKHSILVATFSTIRVFVIYPASMILSKD